MTDYFLNDLSGQELVSFAALFSIALSQGLTSDEIDTLGNLTQSYHYDSEGNLIPTSENQP